MGIKCKFNREYSLSLLILNFKFQAPVKTDPWTETRNATQFGQKCPQPSEDKLGALASFMTPDPEFVYQQSRAAAKADDAEDCLTLDVYTPTVIYKNFN